MQLWFAIIISLLGMYWVGTVLLCIYGFRKLPTLVHAQVPIQSHSLVSIIIAAKDEVQSIANTVRQLWSQDDPHVEWIVVNDRSVDGTEQVLDQLESEWRNLHGPTDTRFRVLHVRELPQGWLGKNHALWLGTQHARGEWFLFADADIQFASDTVTAALAYVMREQADHLALAPRFIARSLGVRAFVGLFLFSLNVVLRPWRCNDDRQTKHGVGIGAFNLLKRSVYEAIGTHSALAMRPDDDLILGQRIKEAGFRQRFVLGHRFIAVEWYPSVRAAVRGLEKNIFSGFGYSLGLAFVMIVGYFFQFHFPFWLIGYVLFFTDGHGAALWLSFALTLLQAGTVSWTSWRFNRAMAWDVLLLPWTTFMVGYTLFRSVWLVHWRRGMYWRGTFYSLQDLKRLAKK